MDTKLASKQDTKTALIQTGIELMHVRGYSNTGVQDVLSALNIPKGSFYHHFDSKENFALEIIRAFDREYSEMLTAVLTNTAQNPVERLRTHCENNKQMLAAQGCRKGCLIGNLGQEMADQSEVLRAELCAVMRKWRNSFAQCIKEGQDVGLISTKYSPDKLAEFFASGWGGAVMRAKTNKNLEPVDTFIEIFFEHVLH